MSKQHTEVESNGFTYGEIKVSRNQCSDGSYFVGVCYRGVCYSIGPSPQGHSSLHDYGGRYYYRIDQVRAVNAMLENGFTVPEISTELCLPERCVRELKQLICDFGPHALDS